MQSFPQSSRCAGLDTDAGRCQLETGHDGLHLAFADGAVLAWSVPACEVYRHSANRLAVWVRNAPWATGFSPKLA